MPRDWDADVYERISSPQEEMGRAVLDRLQLGGDETVLDAGCGTGRVTALLLERLPHGRVLAVDGSPAMVERASERFRGDDRVELRLSDLLDLRVEPPVDAVLSTATFHWIGDHDALFVRLHDALRAGGRLVAQCGGEGNIATVVDAVARAATADARFSALRDWTPWNFARPDETEARLRAAGFEDVRCWLQAWPVAVDDPRTYLGTVSLGSHLERLAPEHHPAFVEAVIAAMPDPGRMDYVRLNIDARRPS